jgi:outer membrane lipoprotein carrier protein
MMTICNRRQLLALATLAGTSLSPLGQAHAAAATDGLQDLARFLAATEGGQAQFTQLVTAPPKAGQSARPRRSSGSFSFLRPNRFRFDYQQPFEQTLVADGQTLWLHDVDLNQVTARPLQSVLSGTPAAVIASARSLDGLRPHFELQAIAPPADAPPGSAWVEARPRGKDGQVQSIKIGLAGAQLVALDVLDSFGQRSFIAFSGWQSGHLPPASRFAYEPPAGADVIRP